jgi:diguanylate cyclase (GGDEF)-like protein
MSAPLFILSFRQREELVRAAEAAGWVPVAAPRGEQAEARFVASGASVALIDARGAAEDGVTAVRTLGDTVEANGGALLVLLSRTDEGLLDDLHMLGATHFLVSPFTEPQLAHAIRFAARHAARLGGESLDPSREGPPSLNASDDRDPLTGAGDRRALQSWTSGRLAGDRAEDRPVVLLLFALSRFDAINLAFGRASGDAVLKAAARRIGRQAEGFGPAGRVARIAGAEFGVLLAAPAQAADAQMLAAHVVQALARPFVFGDQAITLASRAGIAVSRPGDTAASLLRRASAALAEAKGQESGAIGLADADAETAAARGDRLEVDLRRALDADEIELLFQPQVAMADGRVIGVEALARWHHPVYGELGAGTLFGVAQRSDYLVQLSEHVQRKALEQAAAWPDALEHLRIAVNVTAQDVARQGFTEAFLAMAAASGIAPERITVEVTESGLIEDLPAAAALLAQLRAGGFKIAIDDFGTGYSSLAYLKALPLDYLKLDKSLSEDIEGSPQGRMVVRSVIDLARSLGLAVIAEGVETDVQRQALAAEGCAIYQGFLCAPPLSSEALTILIAGEGA